MKISSIKINDHSYIATADKRFNNPYITYVKQIEQYEELGVMYIRVHFHDTENYQDFTKFSTEFITYSPDGIMKVP